MSLIPMIKQTSSFEEAIDVAMILSNAWGNGELSDEVFADKVQELLSHSYGARAFFAVTLSSDCPIMDRLPDPLLLKFRESGIAIVDLIVRNLAMSTAMEIVHSRNRDLDHQLGSQRIKERCIELLRLLEPNHVKEKLEDLQYAIEGKGEYLSFLERWNYDLEQKMAISNSINNVAQA